MDGFVGDSEVMKVNQIAKMELCGIPALILNKLSTNIKQDV